MASQEGLSQDQTVGPGVDEKLKTATIAETLARIEECSTLLKLIRDADLEYMLRRSGLHTLLASNNESLTNVRPHNGEEVEAFLNHYLLPGAFESFDLRRVKNVKSLAGDTLQLRPENGSFRIGAALIVRSDIPCTNGVIHVVTTCS